MNKPTLKNSPGTRPAVRSGKAWSGADIARLIVMAERQMPASRIARKLRRSEGAVRAEAARQRILLPPSSPAPAITIKQPYAGSRITRRSKPPATRARSTQPSDNFGDTLF